MDDVNEMVGLGRVARYASLATYKRGNLAVVPYYSNGGKFGYFVVEEHRTNIGDREGFIYHNQYLFTGAVGEGPYQQALNKLKEIIAGKNL